MFAEIGQDLNSAIRRLRRSPLFTFVAVACLALGIATNTTMFSIFNAIVLRTLPFEHAEQLVSLFERDQRSGRRASVSYQDYLEWRRNAAVFNDMGAHAGRMIAITEGDAERVSGRLVSASLFPVLRVSPQLGRLFTSNDDRPGAPEAVLLSDDLWQRRFERDSAILGRVLSLNGQPHTVVGVMPRGFKFPEMTELWIPMGPVLHATTRTTRGVAVLARLPPEVPLSRATREITIIARRLHEQDPIRADGGPGDWTGDARSLQSGFVGGDERVIATAMLGATAFLLLIACANVANLLLIRAVTQQREIAVRAALGASRGRLARELLSEALLLAGAACLVALPLTWRALRVIQAAIPASDPFPYYVHWSMDVPTFLYAAVASLATGALFGLGPALLASQESLHNALRVGTHGAGGALRHHRVRNALSVVEVGLALVLLIGASLFVRTALGLNRTELGYDPARLMTMRFYLPGALYDSVTPRNRMVEEILRGVQELPGVTAATVSDLIPLDDEGGSQGDVVTEESGSESERDRSVAYAGVAGRWFATLDVAPLEGRVFTEPELLDSIPLAVINRVFATRFWGDASAIGRTFRLARDSAQTRYTVIGVVPDIRTVKLDENQTTPPTAYLPFRFLPTRDYGLMVRTPATPTSVVPEVRAAIRAVDRTVPVFNVWTMEEVRYLSFWMYPMWGAMFGAFGGIALVLATIGIYAVLYYSVTQRTHEIGVRVALGAPASHILRLTIGQGIKLAGVGVALGLVGAFAMTRVVGSLLIGVSPTDPVSFAGVALFLTGVAAVAAYVPARRATRVDPLEVLRQQ
jgi:putative ABC transport system permease protein